MRKLLLALLMIMLAVLPANAQLGLPAQYEYQFRQNTKLTKTTVITAGASQSRNLTGDPQLLLVTGTAYRLAAPLSSNTSTTATASLTLGAYALTSVGHALKVRIHGTTAANANAKTINFVFGSTTVAVMSAVAANAKDFYADIDIYKTGLSAQQLSVVGYANAVPLSGLSVTSAQNELLPITVGVSMPASTGAADVVIDGFEIMGESG